MNDSIWQGSYKIPWDELEFSQRMLKEHLSQEHDLASRKSDWINQQVQWIHEQVLECKPSMVLDLACGPGLYSTSLASLGHSCLGIDFSPASIEYAREQNPEPSRSEFLLSDIRKADFGGPYDLALILYGELNVFSPDEAGMILRKANASLTSEGRLIIELLVPLAVERMGNSASKRQELDWGIFSANPHCLRTDSQWLADQQVAIQTFSITAANDPKSVYRSTTKAWSDKELVHMLRDAGFSEPSISAGWPCNTNGLKLWAAAKM